MPVLRIEHVNDIDYQATKKNVEAVFEEYHLAKGSLSIADKMTEMPSEEFAEQLVEQQEFVNLVDEIIKDLPENLAYILKATYVQRSKLTVLKMYSDMGISRATFFRRKKDSVIAFAVLCHYIIYIKGHEDLLIFKKS
jgi:hypothetical protein